MPSGRCAKQAAKSLERLNAMHAHLTTPDKEAIALLPEFVRLGLDRISLVNTAAQAHDAHDQLITARAWGFDTESKPTFKVGE